MTFWCWLLGSGCGSHASDVSRAAPEIGAAALVLGVALTVGVCAILTGRRLR
jgi:hypothetical protein